MIFVKLPGADRFRAGKHMARGENRVFDGIVVEELQAATALAGIRARAHSHVDLFRTYRPENLHPEHLAHVEADIRQLFAEIGHGVAKKYSEQRNVSYSDPAGSQLTSVRAAYD